ncbi:MAG: DUF4270 domain-containing protein [Chitinophagaceae bacterium]
MKKYSPALCSIVFFIFSFVVFSSCTKINESTELGSDLIPPIDNVNTFDTTLTVETYNEVFSQLTDSSRSRKTDEQFLGYISNDPLFGKTTASMFLELKPASFKYSFGAKKEDLYIDSIVLVLSYRETYGDSSVPQKVNVYQLDQSNNFKSDSFYLLRNNNLTYSNQLGSATFTPRRLSDSLTLFGEKSKNQLRVRLSNSFGQSLLNQDSTGAFASDSAFRVFFKGFAVVPDKSFGGNAVMGFQLTDTNTKLAIYYKYEKNGKRDTFTTFKFNPLSASANLVQRDHAGSQLAGYLGGTGQDNLLFIQNTPGTFARIRIPGLPNINNRIIHRAELIVQQVAHVSDIIFPPPPYLFLDALDSTKSKYRTIPLDLSFDNNGQLNAGVFGLIARRTTDTAGNTINVWRFNISRYVQRVLNRTEPSYELRLSSPFALRDLYRGPSGDVEQSFNVNPFTTIGRVRVGGGNHSTQQMQLRIIYSRL